MLREIAKRIFAKDINGEVDRRVKLALIEADGFYEGRLEGADKRDRLDYDREGILRQTLEAWRTNPLARRLVQLTSQYVVGGGLAVTCRHAQTAAFLKEWWGHRFNQGDMRAVEWCDELVRSGELFFLLSTDAAGMTYVRAVPAIAIEDVFTSHNDVQQETGYLEKPAGGVALGEGCRWPAYDPLDDARDEEGAFPAVMVHYAINRPAGAVRGESDLAPLLRWLARVPDASLLFAVQGLEETTRQMERMAAADCGGQFLTGVDVETPSGKLSGIYRDGERTALAELLDLLVAGGANGRRWLAQVGRERRLRIYEEPVPGSQDFRLLPDGCLADAWGSVVPPWLFPVGVWLKVGDVHFGGGYARPLADAGRVFVETVEYYADSGQLSITPRRAAS
jgi:hypothetical protein